MTWAIECQGIYKNFLNGDQINPVLRGIDLNVPPRDFMMLVGPSGCGKTTLISIIAGILSFDKGSCHILGHNLKDLSASDLLKFRAEHLGFIFQQFNLIPTLSVAQNVSIPLLINGHPLEKSLEKAYQILSEVGLKGREEDFPAQLSGGQQQRVAIARALVHEPDLVICDEPTSSLDHVTGLKVLDLMKEINRRRDTTFVIVTHDSRIFSYADSIAHMDDGHITSLERVKADESVLNTY